MSLLQSNVIFIILGLVWSLRPNDTDIEILNASRKLMESLEADTGLHPGWINNGGLFIADNKMRLAEYQRLMTVSIDRRHTQICLCLNLCN